MSFIRKTFLTLACVMCMGSVSADPDISSDDGEFSDYFDGAMVVYVEKINPSVDMSEKFHEHLLKMYIKSKCKDAKQCHAMGEIVANQFAKSIDQEKEKDDVQRVSQSGD